MLGVGHFGLRTMRSKKINISICFRTQANVTHFLLQVLNVGKSTDELKFVFTDPESGTGGTYTPNPDSYSHEDIIRLVPEVSYHSDGSLLFKMPSYSKRTSTVYRNPQRPSYRRTPLSMIDRWEGFLLYKVHNYQLCRKLNISNAEYLTIAPSWFDGTPFECRLFLGSKSYPTPIPSNDILVQRFSQISQQIDLLILFSKVKERRFPMHIGNSDHVVWSTNNIIEIIPHVPSKQSK